MQAGIVSWRAPCVHDVGRLQGDPDSTKQGLRVHSGVAANSCWIQGTLKCNSSRYSPPQDDWPAFNVKYPVMFLFSSQSCQSNVARSCAECKKDFKKSTSLSGHRVRGRRTKARSLAACWQRCKEKPDCRFVNWVNISPRICHPVIIDVTPRSAINDS